MLPRISKKRTGLRPLESDGRPLRIMLIIRRNQPSRLDNRLEIPTQRRNPLSRHRPIPHQPLHHPPINHHQHLGPHCFTGNFTAGDPARSERDLVRRFGVTSAGEHDPNDHLGRLDQVPDSAARRHFILPLVETIHCRQCPTSEPMLTIRLGEWLWLGPNRFPGLQRVARRLPTELFPSFASVGIPESQLPATGLPRWRNPVASLAWAHARGLGTAPKSPATSDVRAASSSGSA